METLLRIGLSNAVAALLLALAIAVVARVWRRPAVPHALWLLVLVKLVTPPLVWLPEPWTADGGPIAPRLAGDSRSESPTIPAATEPTADLGAADIPVGQDTDIASLTPVPVLASPPIEAEPPPRSSPAPIAPSAPPWWTVAAFILWLAGSLAWYGLAVVRLWRFRRLLRHATPAPESLRQRAGRLADKMGLRRRPEVWLVPGRLAPMLWAAGGRPRVLFPAELLGLVDVEQQNALLVHELAHLRRRDHWVRWLEFVAAGLYWWYPVLWFARRELREAEEQCCDAWVTTTLPGAGKTYAAALLETLDFLSDPPPAAPLLASGIGRVSDLKRRLTMIMRGTTPRTLGWRGVLTVLGAGTLLLPLLPAWARGQAPVKAEADEVRLSGDVKFFALAAPEDIEKSRAELQTLEAQLAQKRAEEADIAAKIQAVRAKLNAQAAKAPPGDGVKGRIVVEVAREEASAEGLTELLKQLQGVQHGAVIVLDKATGKILLTAGEDANQPPPAQALIVHPAGKFIIWAQPAAAAPPGNGTALIGPPGSGIGVYPGTTVPIPGAPPAPNADRRIDELENKLKGILDEVERLRRERKDGPGSDKDAKPLHSYGPAPIENLPLIGGLFRTAPAPAADAGRDLNALQAAHDEEQAKFASLVAARADVLQRAAEAAKERDAQAAAARAEAVKAEEARKEAEVQLARAQAKDPKGDESRAAEAELNVRRAQLEKAKIDLDRQSVQNQKRQEGLLEQTAECEARLKACEADLNRLDKQLTQLKESQGAGWPVKP